MTTVAIHVNGRSYDISCDEGQEARIQELGEYVDQRIRSIAGSGAVGNDAHLYVLTSLLMADEIFDLQEQSQNNDQNAQGQDLNLAISEAVSAREAEISKQIDTVTEQVEVLAQKIVNG